MESSDQLFAKSQVKYPKAVFFIISNEFCERFSYYGMKTILVLYLKMQLLYSDDSSTVLYHTFTMLCYFFPLIGALIADSFLGKFKTILYLSVLYAAGNILLSTAATPIFGIPSRDLSLIGLLFIAIGTGGIKPCVSSFGGDQFELPAQKKQLQQFFSVFYFSINAGSLVSTFLTPVLRSDVQCFGQDTCFPLAFGVPAVLMVLSLIIFIIGKPLYVIKKPEDNVIVRVFGCIGNAISNKCSGRRADGTQQHWLDYANSAKYSHQEVADVKALLNVLYLFLPIPLFWALFDQQGSRWTFQATQMDGRIGSVSIKPDQMQVVNPLLILLFIPLFEICFYPMLAKCGLKRPLQKLTVGGLLAALAFVLSALLEFKIEDSYAPMPSMGAGQIRIFNSMQCDVTMNGPLDSVIPAFDSPQPFELPFGKYNFTLITKPPCPLRREWNGQLEVNEAKSISYFLASSQQGNITVVKPVYEEQLINDKNKDPQIRLFYSSQNMETMSFRLMSERNSYSAVAKNNVPTGFHTLLNGARYNLTGNDQDILSNIQLEPGSISTILLQHNSPNRFESKLITMVKGNTVHMLWQLPQIIVLTAAEIMFSVTGLEFSFTQAPERMKSVLAAAWLLTVAFGNLIVVVVSEIKFFKSQAYEFLLFATLMVLDVGVFVLMAMKYKYVQPAKKSSISNDDNGGNFGSTDVQLTQNSYKE